MIALDTNVLLRVFIDDDATQHARASAFVLAHRAIGGDPPQLLVDAVVICELVWALDSIYRCPKPEITKILDALLLSRDFEVSARGEIQAALRRFREGKGDFADYFIHESAIRSGGESVATFDTKLLREKGFIAP